MVSVVWIVVFRRYGAVVYDVRELLDSTVKLMDGKSPLEMPLPKPLEMLKNHY